MQEDDTLKGGRPVMVIKKRKGSRPKVQEEKQLIENVENEFCNNKRFEQIVDNKPETNNTEKLNGKPPNATKQNILEEKFVEEPDNKKLNDRNAIILDSNEYSYFRITVEFDLISYILFIIAFITRVHKLWLPNNVV